MKFDKGGALWIKKNINIGSSLTNIKYFMPTKLLIVFPMEHLCGVI